MFSLFLYARVHMYRIRDYFRNVRLPVPIYRLTGQNYHTYLHEIAKFEAGGRYTRNTTEEVRIREHTLLQVTILQILMDA